MFRLLQFRKNKMFKEREKLVAKDRMNNMFNHPTGSFEGDRGCHYEMHTTNDEPGIHQGASHYYRAT